MQTTTRNADLTDLMTMLREQHTRKVDVVAPASTIRAVDGNLTIRGAEQIISEDGVTSTDGVYVPTAVADEQVADKLAIPVAYLRRLRTDRPDLYDANVNGWLHGRKALVRRGLNPEFSSHFTGPDRPQQWIESTVREAIPGDPRSFMVRCFRGDDGAPGIARAFLSDRYSVVDNIDVLMAALDGIRDAGVNVDIDGGDLTERRMVVRVTCPEVTALAPVLLAGYRSPFTGESGSDNPTVWAGFQISNSEVGGGAFTITPRLVVQVCRNGMTIAKDALQKIHIGGKMDAGVVRWQEDTQQAAVALVKKQTRDAVQSFLSPEYLTGAIARLEADAAAPVETHEEVRTMVKALRYTDTEVDGILSHFTRGGQMTRGGVVNAVTAYAQTVEDGDAAYALEARATTLLGV